MAHQHKLGQNTMTTTDNMTDTTHMEEYFYIGFSFGFLAFGPPRGCADVDTPVVGVAIKLK